MYIDPLKYSIKHEVLPNIKNTSQGWPLIRNSKIPVRYATCILIYFRAAKVAMQIM